MKKTEEITLLKDDVVEIIADVDTDGKIQKIRTFIDNKCVTCIWRNQLVRKEKK